MAARQICWPPALLFYRCSLDLLSARFRKQLRDFIANISGTQQEIVNRKKRYKLGRSRTEKLNSVYFGPQTAKNRIVVVTHPTGGHQAGHCHASGCFW